MNHYRKTVIGNASFDAAGAAAIDKLIGDAFAQAELEAHQGRDQPALEPTQVIITPVGPGFPSGLTVFVTVIAKG